MSTFDETFQPLDHRTIQLSAQEVQHATCSLSHHPQLDMADSNDAHSGSHDRVSFHKPESQQDRTNPSRRKITKRAGTPKTRREDKPTIPWKPTYLRTFVLDGFIALFGILAALLEVMFAISVRNQGLTSISATSTTSIFRFVWAYGPTAILTLVSAIWARVDYEVKLSAPWLKGWNAEENMSSYSQQHWLLLDYITMFPLAVPWKAFKNRDYLVLGSTVISQLLAALIVLSTGLFSLSLIELHHASFPVVLENRFVDDPKRLEYSPNLAGAVMDAISGSLSTSSPIGISDKYAYQTLRIPPSPVIPGNIYTSVYGMSVGLDCQEANLTYIRILISEDAADVAFRVTSLNTSTRSCETGRLAVDNFGQANGEFTTEHGVGFTTGENILITGVWRGFCENKSDNMDNGRVIIVFAELLRSQFFNHGINENPWEKKVIDSSNSTVLVQSVAVACVPTYDFRRVKITMDSEVVQSIEPQDLHDDTAGLVQVHPWHILEGVFRTYHAGRDITYRRNVTLLHKVQVIRVEEWGPSSVMLKFNQNAFRDSVSVFNHSAIQTTITRFYQQLGAVIIQQSLLEPALEQSTATAVWKEDRLVVQRLSCHWMTGAFLLSSCILFLMRLKIPTAESVGSATPGSVMGTTILARRFLLCLGLDYPRGSGGADQAALQQSLQAHCLRHGVLYERRPTEETADSVRPQRSSAENITRESSKPSSGEWIRPWTLRFLSQLLVNISVLACIIILEITHHKSTQNQWLVNELVNESYLEYTWKTLPAIFLVLLGVFFSSVDFETRIRAPYKALSTGRKYPRSAKWLYVDLVRPLMPRVFELEVRLRAWAALATTLAALFSTTFPVFYGSVFLLISISTTVPVQLRCVGTFFQNTTKTQPWSFNNREEAESNLISSLILGGNLSYPDWTYEDLVLPKMVLGDFDFKRLVNKSSQPANNGTGNAFSPISFDSMIPALRTRLSCQLYDQAEISHNITYEAFSPQNSNVTVARIEFNITRRDCENSADGEVNNATLSIRINDTSSRGYFGACTESVVADLTDYGCKKPSPPYLLYIWGYFSTLTNPPSVTLSAMSCEERMESVDVAALFILAGHPSNLTLNLSKPVQPDESTVVAIPRDQPEFHALVENESRSK